MESSDFYIIGTITFLLVIALVFKYYDMKYPEDEESKKHHQ